MFDDKPSRQKRSENNEPILDNDKKELSEMEDKLFGLTRLQMRNERHTDKTWIPIKTGV